MAFQDYSNTPANNTTAGDDIFTGPNMPRDNVRPAIQQLMADGRTLRDEMLAMGADGTLPAYIAAEDGGVERTALAKMRDQVSVLDFIPVAKHAGIVAGTNTDDLTDFIQAALDTGRSVHFPAGTYWIDPTPGILPTSNQTIFGDGHTSILKALASDDGTRGVIYMDGKDRVTIRDLFIQGERDIHTDGGSGYVTGNIVNVISAGAGTGMTATVTASNGRIIKTLRLAAGTGYVAAEPVTLTANTGSGVGGEGILYTTDSGLEITFGEKIMGVLVYNSTNVLIENVRCDDCWGDGFYIGGTGVSGQSSNVRLINCEADGCRRNGLSIVAVDGCRVEGGRFTSSLGVIGAECGIDIEPNPGKGAVNDVVVSGATCTGNGGPGVALANAHATNVAINDAYSCENGLAGLSAGIVGEGLKVRGGFYNDNGEHGIHIFGDGTTVVMNASLEGAEAHGNTLSGICVMSNVMRFQITGARTSLNGQHGIHLELVTGNYVDKSAVRGVQAWNNSQTTNATYDNIYIGPGCHNVCVSDCWVRKNEPTSIISNVTVTPTNQPRYGINSSANESNYLLFNDVIDGGATANMVIQTNNVVRGNIGFKTENRVLSSGFNVETSGTKTVTINHGCAYTPSTHHCQFSVIGTSGYAFTITNTQLRSVNATQVQVDVTVGTGTGASGNTANIALSVERPSPL